MNKKSALVTAGGVAGSFIAGAAAVSFNWGMGTPAPAGTQAAATTPGRTHVKPIVKHRRIVVHRKASSSTGPATAGSRTVTLAPPTQSPPAVTTSGSHGGGGEGEHEHEGGDD